jgi:hypothetical protein
MISNKDRKKVNEIPTYCICCPNDFACLHLIDAQVTIWLKDEFETFVRGKQVFSRIQVFFGIQSIRLKRRRRLKNIFPKMKLTINQVNIRK